MELLRRSGATEGWLDERDHALLTAVSRLTPGTNVLAYCVGLGWQVGGWLGALVSVLAASVPGSMVIVALSAALVRVDHYPIVRFLIAAGVLAATGLVASSAWYLLKPYLNRSMALRGGVIAVAVVGLLILGVTPVRVLLAAAALGALLGMPAVPHAGARDR